MSVRKCFVAVIGLSAVLGGGLPALSAQELTEQFIPIGQSPGLSGKQTVIGKLQSVNPTERSCTVVAATGTVRVNITERTKIWLDRSQLRQSNRRGTIADLRPGATVEVKPEGHRPGVSSGAAEWIKVQVTESR